MEYFSKNSFEQQCVLLHALLNQGELHAHCSFIGINDAYFHPQYLSRSKSLFSETLSPTHHGQVSFYE